MSSKTRKPLFIWLKQEEIFFDFFFEMYISSYLDNPAVEIHCTLYVCFIRAVTFFPLMVYKIKIHCTIDKSFI